MNQNNLKELLHYEPNTGIFTWLTSPARRIKINDIAGSMALNGYFYVCFKYKKYLLHRLAWMYVYGLSPKNEIDHINGDPSDNRIANLREATRSENMLNVGKYSNNTSGYKGVSWCKVTNKWETKITINGKRKNLGYFDTAESGYSEYCKAASGGHGEFSRV